MQLQMEPQKLQVQSYFTENVKQSMNLPMRPSFSVRS